jgi:DNA-binding CsgD family transcriptional regulator
MKSAKRFALASTVLMLLLIFVTMPALVSAHPVSSSWKYTGSIHDPRVFFAATKLPNGKVLVEGGINDHSPNAPLSSAELYNPATGTWSLIGSLNVARFAQTAILLHNGKVLIFGAEDAKSNMTTMTELYDPVTSTWSLTGNMHYPRVASTGTLLENGKVLVTGGFIDFQNDITATAELYDPISGIWSLTGSMLIPRAGHVAVLLHDGNVLVTGGGNTTASPLASTKLYHPVTGKWSSTGQMQIARLGASITLLDDGQVLVAGGDITSAELYNPQFGTWSLTGSMNVAREREMIKTLPANQLLTSPMKSSHNYPDGLTAREIEVLRLIAQGLTDAQVAEQLVISPHTVNAHLKSIYGKIQVSSRSAATRYALVHQLL